MLTSIGNVQKDYAVVCKTCYDIIIGKREDFVHSRKGNQHVVICYCPSCGAKNHYKYNMYRSKYNLFGENKDDNTILTWARL